MAIMRTFRMAGIKTEDHRHWQSVGSDMADQFAEWVIGELPQ